MFRSSAMFCLLVLATSVEAGFFDDVQGMAGDVGDFFQKKFESAKDLFASNQSELEKNINRVKELLEGVKEKAKMLEPIATDAQKATIAKVDEYHSQVEAFQKEATAAGASKFDQMKAKWEQMVDQMFNKGGLQDLMKLLNNDARQYGIVSAIMVPIVVAICQY